MGLQSSLTTALTGLTAAETQISVIGNNLANSNTVAFKASQAEFATQFLQTLSLGGAPTADSGGTNPRQIGLGTMVAEITPNFSQGTIEISANPTDLAIQGDGFFIVEGVGDEQLYTRNGIFQMNADNELTTPTGGRLLGFGVDERYEIQTTEIEPLQIPLGSREVALATENVYLQGTLTPQSELGVADTAEILESDILGDGRYTAPPSGATLQAITKAPATTTGTGFTTGGAMEAGTYGYRIVFGDGTVGSITDTEGVPSDATALITVGPSGPPATGRVVLDNIPTDPDDYYSTRRIYRTDKTGTGPYYYVGEITNNVDTTFTDTLIDDDADDNDQLIEDTISGDYSYYVTFATASGFGNGTESRPSEKIGSLQINGRAQLRDLPVDTSGQWTYRRIYRNLADDSNSFYYVGEIADAATLDLTFTDKVADADIEDPTKMIDLDGPKILSSTPLVQVVRRDGEYYDEDVFEVGTLEFTARKGGRRLAPKELEITSDTTVLELINFMEEAMGIQEPPGPDSSNPIPPDSSGDNPGGTVTTDGRICLVGNNGVHNAIDIDLDAMQVTTTSGQENVSVRFGSVQSAVGESAATDFIVYDSLGIPLNVRLTTVLQNADNAGTTYRWFADCQDNDPASGVEIAVGTGLVTFDGTGKFVQATETSVSVDRRNIPSTTPLVFDLDFSELSGLAAETSSLAVSGQDGSAPGTLTNFVVGEDGRIRGIFSNGITRDLGQIRLARFSNPTGLEQKGENLFAGGVNSGQPVQGNPGEMGIGKIQSGAVELSNTDIGGNLVDLIIASTMYRGNTRVITTVQEMMDELLALRR